MVPVRWGSSEVRSHVEGPQVNRFEHVEVVVIWGSSLWIYRQNHWQIRMEHYLPATSLVGSHENFIFCRYYSSEERKYLKMSFEGRNVSKHDQATALKNGLHLAWALNRTLILPKFYHKKGYTHFLDIFGYCISILDEMVEVTYREHMFLENHLVQKKFGLIPQRCLIFLVQLESRKYWRIFQICFKSYLHLETSLWFVYQFLIMLFLTLTKRWPNIYSLWMKLIVNLKLWD